MHAGSAHGDDETAQQYIDQLDEAIAADLATPRIRGELDQLDVQVTDTTDGPTWQLR